jgi:heterotetrameric sarcosine oxidase gamma subunit
MSKVLVRAPEDGAVASTLGIAHGRSARDAHATLVVGSGPGEWLLLAAPGMASALAARVPRPDGELVTVIDFTHSRALVRLSGPESPLLLAKVCAIDLADAVTPNGSALRTSVAKLVTDVVRDDLDGLDDLQGQRTVRSYLLHCERSSGQYLFDALADAGAEHDIEIAGFTASGT